MQPEVANQYVAVHAFALKVLTVTFPNDRTYCVNKGMIFAVSPSVADRAARLGLCRAVDLMTDSDAPIASDAALFAKHGAQFFKLPYGAASFAIRIDSAKEPQASIVIDASRPSAPSAPEPRTGFEFK
jgi:hypothetical protein